MNNTFNIFVLNTVSQDSKSLNSQPNNMWQLLAKVINGKLTLNGPERPSTTTNPQIITDCNQFICEQILKVQGTMNLPEYSNSFRTIKNDTEYIKLLFLGTLRYRRGTVYIVLQYSKEIRNLRIMAYGTNQIVHNGSERASNAQSFGTSLNDLSEKDIKDGAIEIIKNRLKKENIVGDLYNPSENIVDTIHILNVLKTKSWLWFI